jgi:hypothetical protein
MIFSGAAIWAWALKRLPQLLMGFGLLLCVLAAILFVRKHERVKAELAQTKATLVVERAEYKKISDAAVKDRVEREQRAEFLAQQNARASEQRENERLEQIQRERDLLDRIGRLQYSESGLRAAISSQSKGFSEVLERAKTDTDKLGVCQSLIERYRKATSGLASVLVQDRAEGQRAIDTLADATAYIAVIRTQCETSNTVNTQGTK